MGKHEVMTPKAIAKKIKAKGLQKLRWYCQMCEKQCRDANGFKCHMESESHLRQMAILGSNTGKYIDSFSKDFEAGFMDIVKRRYRTKRVHANVVYNEYIKDRQHVHLNATRWVTLTGFVMYLGKSGKAKVEETPKGWYIQYVERDPEVLAQQEKLANKKQMDLNDEERTKLDLEKRMKLAKDAAPSSSVPTAATELKRDQDFKISFSLGTKKESSASSSTVEASTPEEDDVETVDFIPGEGEDILGMEKAGLTTVEDEESSSELPIESPASPVSVATKTEKDVEKLANQTSTTSTTTSTTPEKEPTTAVPAKEGATANKDKDPKKRQHESETKAPKVEPKITINPTKKKKLSAVELIAMEEEKKKESRNRKDYWLMENIIVKVLNKELADGKYYKQKGTVKKVIDKYIAVIQMHDSGDLLKLDQGQLETVIPAIGSKVRIVNGAYRGEEATLLSVNTDQFKAQIRLDTGNRTASVIYAEYEDICKVPS